MSISDVSIPLSRIIVEQRLEQVLKAEPRELPQIAKDIASDIRKQPALAGVFADVFGRATAKHARVTDFLKAQAMPLRPLHEGLSTPVKQRLETHTPSVSESLKDIDDVALHIELEALRIGELVSIVTAEKTPQAQLKRLGEIASPADRIHILLTLCSTEPEVVRGLTSFSQVGLNYSNRWDDGTSVQSRSTGPDLLRLLTVCQSTAGHASSKIESTMQTYTAPKLEGALPIKPSELLDRGKLPNPEPMGRTLIYYKTDGTAWAVKMRKPHEPVSEFHREAAMQHTLGALRKDLSLQSDYPTPIGIGTIQVPELDVRSIRIKLHGIDESTQPTGGGFPMECFIYQVKGSDYFAYVNQSEHVGGLQEMQSGLCRGAFDIFRCSSIGFMYTQLVDLYHSVGKSKEDRSVDGGKALMLLDVIRAFDSSTGGMGSVKNIHGGTAYPNVRKSGLADVGDALPLHQVTRGLEIVQRLVKAGLFVEENGKDREKSYVWTPLYQAGFDKTLAAKGDALRSDPELMMLLRERCQVKDPEKLTNEELAATILRFSRDHGSWESCAHMLDLCRLDTPGELVARAKAEVLAEQMVSVMLLGATYFLRDQPLMEALRAESKTKLAGKPGASPTLTALSDTLRASFEAAVCGYLGRNPGDKEVAKMVGGVCDFDLLALQIGTWCTMTGGEMDQNQGAFDKQLKALYPGAKTNWEREPFTKTNGKYGMTFEDQGSLTGLPKHLGSPGTQMPLKAFESLAYALSTMLLAHDMSSLKVSDNTSLSTGNFDFFSSVGGSSKYVNQAWYRDDQMWRALTTDNRITARTSVMAPLSDIEDGQANLTPGFLSAEYRRLQQLGGQAAILVPYNLGNNHWVGVRIDIDFAHLNDPGGVKLRYMDSLGASLAAVAGGNLENVLDGLPPTLRDQLSHFFTSEGLQDRVQRDVTNHLRQEDSHSCGPFTVENLLDPNSNAQPNMTPLQIRDRHHQRGVQRQLVLSVDVKKSGTIRAAIVEAVSKVVIAKALSAEDVRALAKALAEGKMEDLGVIVGRQNPATLKALSSVLFGTETVPPKPELSLTLDDRQMVAALVGSLV